MRYYFYDNMIKNMIESNLNIALHNDYIKLYDFFAIFKYFSNNKKMCLKVF